MTQSPIWKRNFAKQTLRSGTALALGTLMGLSVASDVMAQGAAGMQKFRRPVTMAPPPPALPPEATPAAPAPPVITMSPFVVRATPAAPTGDVGAVASSNVAIESGVRAMVRGSGVAASLLEATSLDDFITRFPDSSQNPAVATPTLRARSEQTSGEETAQEGARTRTLSVTRQDFSMSSTPNEIVTFEPIAGFWLGSIVEDRGLRAGLGSQREVPIPATSRAPFVATINSLAIPSASRAIDSPSMSSFNNAIGSMIQGAGNIDYATSASFNIVDNFDATQAAMALGIDAKFLGARVKAALETTSNASRQAITMTFVQRAFTVSMDTEGRNRRAAFFNDNFTLDQAKALVNEDRWGGGVGYLNAPSYIKSITYGRAVIVTITSNISRSTMKQFLEATYNSGAVDATGTYNFENLQRNERFEMQITTFGGSGQQLNKLIKVMNTRADVVNALNEYVKAPASLTTMVPISYVASSLRDDVLTALRRTTQYTVTEYAPQPMGHKVDLGLRFVVGGNDGIGDSVNEIWGTVRVNGQIVSQIDRIASGAFPRAQGQTLDLQSRNGQPITVDWYFGDEEPLVEVEMWDSDDRSGDDLLFRRQYRLPMGGIDSGQTITNNNSYYEEDQSGTSTMIINMKKAGSL